MSITAQELDAQLTSWLSQGKGSSDGKHVRAIIAPHAGYAYSGPTAGHAYSCIEGEAINRIFILGPSHHVRLGGCALSPNSSYETPIGSLTIDSQVYASLFETGLFEVMTTTTDEDEHSIEMHLPFIVKVMSKSDSPYTIVPILVGSLSLEKQAVYAKILSPFLDDPHTVFIISSDFCHWGSRFHYQFYDKSWGSFIHESISKLDEEAFKAIESLSSRDFHSYLKKYGNTVCGRHPIGLLLSMIECLVQDKKKKPILKFNHYAQSSQVKSMEDSSVSYAAASLVFHE